jgi:hypothetical protein
MIKRIYHSYEVWEDYLNGMWRKETKQYEEQNINKVIEFTGNHNLYGAAMFRVIEQWPFACEHNLTNNSINRKAWIGQAACCIEHGWPEYLVRKAWWQLTENQRNLADKQALLAIKQWEQKQRSKSILKHGKPVAIQMDFLMLHH